MTKDAVQIRVKIGNTSVILIHKQGQNAQSVKEEGS